MVRARRALSLVLIALAPLLGGCQVTYLVKSAYHQVALLGSRVPLEKALEDSRLSEDQKQKLRLAMEAIEFAENDLGLKRTDNYRTYVHLDRPYVTYVVNAAHRQELKAYRWWFPVVGSMPYKGYFNPDGAKSEAESMRRRGYDAYVRGVSAYSTLGWFSDPLLSSMLRYKNFDLVETVIHETVHATIYIKGHADFNERLAVFIGRKGAEEFYKKKEGPDSPTLRLIRDDLADQKTFIDFMAKELKSLEGWYTERKDVHIPEEERRARLNEITARFKSEVRPKLLLADSYRSFENEELNNATLLNYRLYFESLDNFEAAFKNLGGDFKKMLEFCKSLETSADPIRALEKAARTSGSADL